MPRLLIAATALLALVLPAIAEDGSSGPVEAPVPPAAPSPAPVPRRPMPDLSRSVTLTGYEVQALIAAIRAEAQAQAATAAAAPVSAKVTEALTPAPSAR